MFLLGRLSYIWLCQVFFLNDVRDYLRAIGNSIETLFFVAMAYSSFIVMMSGRKWLARYYFGLVVFGAFIVCYPYLINGYQLQRVTGPGFLSEAILGPSVLFVYWMIGAFLCFTGEFKKLMGSCSPLYRWGMSFMRC